MSAILPSIRDARLPETHERAKQALAECSRIDECQDCADESRSVISLLTVISPNVSPSLAMAVFTPSNRLAGGRI